MPEIDVEKRWQEMYKRLGFTKAQIAFYENTPMLQRKTEWRRLDEIIFQDFKKQIRTRKMNTSHQVITDSIEMKSMVDGKTYTSKSQYYASLKAADSHIVEKGEHKPQAGIKGDFSCKKELREALRQHHPNFR